MTDLGLWIDTGYTNLVADNVGDGATALTGVTSSPWPSHDSPLAGGAARRLTQGSGTGDGFFRLLSMTGGATYTASRYYKYDDSTNWVRMSISDNVAHGYFAYLNLATMSAGISGAFGDASLVNVTLTPSWNGWCRLSLTGILPNTHSACGFFSHSVVGDGLTTRVPGSYGIWADQVLLGQEPCSPSLTTFGNVRAADNATIIAPVAGRGTLTLSDSSQLAILPSGGS